MKTTTHTSTVTLQGWLTRNGSSLRKLCDDVGLPPPARTVAEAKDSIRTYFKEHGRRPTAN